MYRFIDILRARGSGDLAESGRVMHDDKIRFVLLEPRIQIAVLQQQRIFRIREAKDVIHVAIGIPADSAYLDGCDLRAR